jgi:hypothetical protein
MALNRVGRLALILAGAAAMAACFPILPADYPDTVHRAASAASAPASAVH